MGADHWPGSVPALSPVAAGAKRRTAVEAPAGRRLLLAAALVALDVPWSLSAFAASLEWVANGTTPGSGGTGTWNTTTSRWFNGSSFQVWNNVSIDDAVFDGVAGTVTLGTPITVHNLTFNTGGYLVTGSTLTLSGSIPSVTVLPAGSATIASTVAGTSGFNQAGAGTLILTGTNTFTGGTTISAGTLQLGSGGTTGSVVGDIVDNAALIINRSNALTYAGVISGSGTLTKSGAGTLTLTNDSTYSGGTTISTGTLQLGNGGTTGSVAGNIVDNAALIFNRSDTLTYGGVISGSGTLNQAGPGTLILTGANTFTGGTTVSGGTLLVGDIGHPGASIVGDVMVDPGSTLGGHGMVFGSIINVGGTVVPGGSIGVLTVAGNYIQATNGSLTIEVSPGAASQLKVGGAANLAGTLSLLFDPGAYAPATFKILTAASVNGTFSTVTGTNPSGLPQAIAYNPTDVTLQLSALPGSLVVVPTDDTIYTDLASTLVLNAQRMQGIILDRIGVRSSGIADGQIALDGFAPALQLAQTGNAAAIGHLASALPQALSAKGAWFRGIGSFVTLDSTAAAPGFRGSAGGFLAGFDRPVSDNVYLGLAGGYLHSAVDEFSTGASGAADTGRVAVYGGALLGPSLLTATAGYAHDWITTSRGVALGTARQGHGANEATAAAQWSLPLRVEGLARGLATLTPKVGAQFLHLDENSFAETGAAGFDLAAPGHATDSLQPYVQLALAQTFVTVDGTIVTPELRAGYNREAMSGVRALTVATIDGSQFPVTGIRPSKNIATAGFGLTAQSDPALSLYATYDAMLPIGNTTEHTVQAGLRWRF